jgi:hypothetical protein
MTRSSSFSPYHQGAQAVRAPTRTTQGAADFLRAHDKMASLLPAVTRMAALQKDCAAILPDMFNDCAVLQFESDQLTLSTPNAALAAKLKQVLPKLKDALAKRGWQVSAIRLKVQVTKNVEKSMPLKRLIMPVQAVSALSALSTELEETPRNATLIAALNALVRRHRDMK